MLDGSLSRLRLGCPMFNKKSNGLMCGCMLAFLMSGCVKPPEQPRVEQSPQPQTLLPPAPPTSGTESEPALKLPPPTQAEVRGAIARLYKDAVIVEPSRFVVGDFNGDGSQDVAVVVTPATGMLGEINSEVANWILEDPQKIVIPDPKNATQRLAPIPAPTRVSQSDVLLAVLHGHGPAGWRNTESRQTYLLRNAVGSEIKSESMAACLKATNGKTIQPKLRGDVISETIGAGRGFLYYSGAKYVWYPMAASVASK
jgi:hypothetical protein